MPKRHLTGGGSNLKNQEKSNKYVFRIFENLKYFAGQSFNFLTPRREEELSRGAILIEFAICMPILIILLFYIHDLVKIKRYYSQTEFVAQQMANILQNIAKTRAVTRNDIERAASLAYLTIYPGITMFGKKSGSPYHEFVHMPRCYVYYVKGLSDGKASCVWARWVNTSEYLAPKWNYNSFTSNSEYSIIKWGTNVTPSSIYPTLKVEAGKAKIILEAHLRWNPSLDNDTQGKKRNFSREVFGSYLVNPKFQATNAFFPSVVIFTPNSGFSETVPS